MVTFIVFGQKKKKKHYWSYLLSAKVSEVASKETTCKELSCQFSRLWFFSILAVFWILPILSWHRKFGRSEPVLPCTHLTLRNFAFMMYLLLCLFLAILFFLHVFVRAVNNNTAKFRFEISCFSLCICFSENAEGNACSGQRLLS